MPHIVRRTGHWLRWHRSYNRRYYPRATNREHPLAGATALTITAAGALATRVALAGAAAVVFTTTGGLTVEPRVAGASALTFAVSGLLSVDPLDHWAGIRPGDMTFVLLPYAGTTAFCGLVRVLGYTFRDEGGELLEVETQWIEPVTIETPLRFLSEGGAVPAPVVAQVSQVAEVLSHTKEEVARLGLKIYELEQEGDEPIAKDRLVSVVVGAINDSSGGIDAGKTTTGTLGSAVVVPAITLDGAVEVDANSSVKLGGATDLGSGQKVIAIPNATTNPSVTPSGGGVLYADAGALKWLGSSGTVTTLGPAEPHCPVCGRDFALEFTHGPSGDRLAVCLWCLTGALGDIGVIEKVVGDALSSLGWGAQPAPVDGP